MLWYIPLILIITVYFCVSNSSLCSAKNPSRTCDPCKISTLSIAYYD